MKSRFIAILKNLRKAYIEVKTFMENTTWDKMSTINTTIDNDPGCSVDDNYFLIEKLWKRTIF